MVGILVSVATKLAMSLVAESVIKQVAMLCIEKLVKSTKNTWDDELYAIAEKKWESS